MAKSKTLVSKSVSSLVLLIEEATEPKAMTKNEALETMETVIDELKMRCEALREEIAEE